MSHSVTSQVVVVVTLAHAVALLVLLLGHTASYAASADQCQSGHVGHCVQSTLHHQPNDSSSKRMDRAADSATHRLTIAQLVTNKLAATLGIILGSTALFLYFVLMFNRKSKRSSSGQVADGVESLPPFKIVGKGIDFEQQSVQFKDNPVERISRLLEQRDGQLVTHQFDDVLTLNDVFERGYQVSNNGKCLGQVNREEKCVEYLTYAEVRTRMHHFADGLIRLDLQPKKSCLGIYAANSREYVIAEYGCYRHTLVVVPIYDTLGSNVCSYIANQAEMTTIAVDKLDRIEKIVEKASDYNTLKHIILMKSNLINDEIRDKVDKAGFKLHTMEEIERMGEKDPVEADNKPSVNDLAIICYTSGTTSMPKGVMLSHENVVASVATISIHLMDQHATTEDVMISILPLAHMFQRIGEASVFCEGGKVAYYSGDITQLAAEIPIVRPTIMLAVPRLLNRIYDAIQNKVRDSFIKRTLLRLAYQAKRKDLERRIIRTNSIWDRIVFDKVRQQMGSRVRLICVGSAPLSHNVLDFLRCALGCVISEGYGQTECVGPCTATVMGDYTTGHVGPPLVGSLVKLADIPDMGYYACEGKGEILVKGPVVFKGYYKLPEQTSEALDSEGWLHTGDIGVWNKEGTLKLIDRKKNIFKLSQGEYIAPEKIENVLINSRYVAQIFIYGQSLKSTLVAIVVPDMEAIKSSQHPRLQNLKSYDEKELNKIKVKEAVLEDIQLLGREAGLKSFELPKNIYLNLTPFSIESGLLTPTLKSKRNVITKHFEKQIAHLYKESDARLVQQF